MPAFSGAMMDYIEFPVGDFLRHLFLIVINSFPKLRAQLDEDFVLLPINEDRFLISNIEFITAPGILGHGTDHSRSQWILLDILHNSQQMIVFADQGAVKSALSDMSATLVFVVIPARMSHRNAVHNLADGSIF